MGLLIDLIPNSPATIVRIIWQKIRRITDYNNKQIIKNKLYLHPKNYQEGLGLCSQWTLGPVTETEKEVKIPFSIILKETAARAVGLRFQQCFILVVGYGNILE